MGRAFVEEVFQGRETMGVRDVDVEGSDINSRHDGVGRKRHRQDHMISRKCWVSLI